MATLLYVRAYDRFKYISASFTGEYDSKRLSLKSVSLRESPKKSLQGSSKGIVYRSGILEAMLLSIFCLGMSSKDTCWGIILKTDLLGCILRKELGRRLDDDLSLT